MVGVRLMSPDQLAGEHQEEHFPRPRALLSSGIAYPEVGPLHPSILDGSFFHKSV